MLSSHSYPDIHQHTQMTENKNLSLIKIPAPKSKTSVLLPWFLSLRLHKGPAPCLMMEHDIPTLLFFTKHRIGILIYNLQCAILIKRLVFKD